MDSFVNLLEDDLSPTQSAVPYLLTATFFLVPPLKTKCIGVPNIVVEHGAPGLIKRDLKLDPEGMFETILSFVNSTPGSKFQGNGAKCFLPRQSIRSCFGSMIRQVTDMRCLER